MKRFASPLLLIGVIALGAHAVDDLAPQQPKAAQQEPPAILKKDNGDVPPEGRQKAVSREAVEYLEKLRKNTPFGTNGFDLKALRAGMGSRREPTIRGVKLIRTKVGDIPCEWVVAPGADPDLRLLYLHGGGFVSGSGGYYLPLASHISAAAKCAVLLPDDSIRVAKKARADGIQVKLEDYRGMFHVFQSHEPLLPEAREAIEHIADFIRSSLPGSRADAGDLVAIEHQRRTIYHSPQKPGFTSWCGAWTMPDGSLMVSFTQATGPVAGRLRAPKEVQDKLTWPPPGQPGYDMTGLDLRNVHLRSTDAGKTWKQVSADAFKSCMNGVSGEAETALADGTVIRGVFGFYLPYDAEVPKTGFLQRSSDGTKSWGKPEVLLDPAKYTTWPRRIRVLRDGRLVVLLGVAPLAAGSHTRDELSKRLRPTMVVSSDKGKTWKGPIPAIPKEQPDGWTEEFDVAELAAGDLLAVFRRASDTKRWQGLLKKAGDVWIAGKAGPSVLPHSGQPELIATREGPILHVATSGIHATSDAGTTWDKSQQCEPRDFKSVYGFFGGETWLWQARSGKIWALVRVDSNELPIKDRPIKAGNDQADHFILFSSGDRGRTFDRIRDFGDYGEMYMSLLRLRDRRLLLTFTVRDLHPPLGVRALFGVETDDGFEFDFAHDRLILDTRTPSGASQGGGFGPTVQLADETLVTSYSYRGGDGKTHLEAVRWKAPTPDAKR